MSSNLNESTREEQVNQVIATYLKSVEEGHLLDRQALLAKHPDLAEDLAAFFADRDRFDLAAAPLRASAGLPGIDAPTLDRSSADPAGPGAKIRYFGDYELLEEIARGGMGVVYKARQVNLKRIVALKLILAGQLAGPQEVERFHAEAEAAAKLDHPGIVPIFEVGQHEGQHYFSMAFVEGESLARRLAQGVMEPRAAAALLKKVAEAIAYAHVEGVIHRDLKPANILLDRGGTPRVTDFGLAKRVEDDQRGLTVTGQVLGTPSYMPPEQAAGNMKDIGPHSDVYSLGAVLYCALAGRPPFQAANPIDTLIQVRGQEAVPLRQLNAEVPRDLETIALKCLEKEPRRRYGSAQDVADELQRYLDGKPVMARPVGAAGRLSRWCRRQPVMAGLIAAVAVTLVAGTFVSSMFAMKALDERDRANGNAARADQKAEEAESQKNRAEVQLLRARTAEYSIQVGLAQRDLRDGDYGEAEELLDGCASDLRGWEHRYLWTKLCQRRIVLKGHTNYVNSVAFSPDGRRIVSGSGDNTGGRDDHTVKVWDVATGKETLTLNGHTGTVNSVAFSPDGRRIVSGSGEYLVKIVDGQRFISGSGDNTVKVWDAGTGQEMLTLKGHTAPVISVAFSPDGRRIVSGSAENTGRRVVPGDNTVKVWDATTGKETLTLKGYTGGGVASVAFSPDGRRIASSSDNDVKVWDADTGKETLTLKGHTAWVSSVAFSPDGRRIVSASGDRTVKVWDAATGQETLTLKGHTGIVTSVAFSPAGRRIFSGSWDGTVKVWDADTGKEMLTLKGHTGIVTSVAFSPDGQRIATGSGDKTVRVWDVAMRQETLTIKAYTNPVWTVAFSPDGQRIVTGSIADNMVKIWDASTGQAALTIKAYTNPVWTVAFSPDGGQIVSSACASKPKVWDAATGKETVTLSGPNLDAHSAAFSPDGRRIVSGSGNGTVKVWDAATGQETLTLKGHTGIVNSVAFSPDGRRIVSGSDDKTVKVWDATTGQETLAPKGHTSVVNSVAFSPDGRRIVSGSWDGTVRVWDATTGQETLRLKGNSGQVYSVSFSPDGRRIVSGSNDSTVKVWDATTGQETLTLKGHTEAVSSVAFSPDGRRIASGSRDNTVKIWDAGAGQEAHDGP